MNEHIAEPFRGILNSIPMPTLQDLGLRWPTVAEVAQMSARDAELAASLFPEEGRKVGHPAQEDLDDPDAYDRARESREFDREGNHDEQYQ